MTIKEDFNKILEGWEKLKEKFHYREEDTLSNASKDIVLRGKEGWKKLK